MLLQIKLVHFENTACCEQQYYLFCQGLKLCGSYLNRLGNIWQDPARLIPVFFVVINLSGFWSRIHKTLHFLRNLRMAPISSSVCYWKTFPPMCNLTL